jgi:malectin (di-glucose binding ER protein)
MRSIAMPENSGLLSVDEERLELEALTQALGRSSRLAHLLNYVVEKYFAGESDQLSEYNIATEVFGRSKASFDATEDAIARVEAHRLRKRLKEFYEGPGKDHLVQLSIPPGTYIPAFTHRPVEISSPTSTEPSISFDRSGATPASGAEAASPPAAKEIALSNSKLLQSRNWLLAGLVVVLAAGAAATIDIVFRSHTAVPVATAPHSIAAAPFTPREGAPAPVQVPFRVLAGYSGAPQSDSAGQVWGADQYVRGGGPWRVPDAAIARTSDPFIFQHWRTGDSSYDIPLAAGVYELHLFFVTSDSSSESYRTFTVRINGEVALSGFDINSDAMGENIADERVFRDVSPADDGMLHISFVSERGAPLVNAIEVLRGIPHKQLPIRLVMQSTSFTDHDGQFWQPDNYFLNGRMSDHRQEIAGSPDPDLFAMERYGHFTYAIPVDTRGQYTLILHFVELYFGSQAGGGGVGSRVFRVMCNGETLLDNFDVYKEAGSLHVLTKTFYHLKPSAQGKLNITFEPMVNNATISGIEVLDESQ